MTTPTIRQQIITGYKLHLSQIRKENDYNSDAGKNLHEYRERPWDRQAGELPGLELRDTDEDEPVEVQSGPDTLLVKPLQVRVFIVVPRALDETVNPETTRNIIADVYKATKNFQTEYGPAGTGLIDDIKEVRNSIVTDAESDQFLGVEIFFTIRYRHRYLDAYNK